MAKFKFFLADTIAAALSVAFVLAVGYLFLRIVVWLIKS